MSRSTGWVKRAWDRIKQFTTLAIRACADRWGNPPVGVLSRV